MKGCLHACRAHASLRHSAPPPSLVPHSHCDLQRVYVRPSHLTPALTLIATVWGYPLNCAYIDEADIGEPCAGGRAAVALGQEGRQEGQAEAAEAAPGGCSRYCRNMAPSANNLRLVPYICSYC